MLMRNLDWLFSGQSMREHVPLGRRRASLIFPPYQVFHLGGVKVGFVGYNDPLTPTRQPPAYSAGIRFTRPEEDLAGYVTALREREGCDLVFVLAHLGLAQQINLSNAACAKGVDYILGGDTHERIREPVRGTLCESHRTRRLCILRRQARPRGRGREDQGRVLCAAGRRSGQYPEDEEMRTLVAAACAPYRKETDRVIGRTTTPLLRYYVMETPTDNLITDALMWKFGTDFVVSNGFRFCPPLVPPPGARRRSPWVSLEHAARGLTHQVRRPHRPADPRLAGEGAGKRLRQGRDQALRRLAGALQGAAVKFTIGNVAGERVQEVSVQGQPLEPERIYTVLGAEREGDPDDVIYRLHVRQARVHDVSNHAVLEEYLAVNSPVAPVIEGRAVATDAPADLLTQIEGTSYRFR